MKQLLFLTLLIIFAPQVYSQDEEDSQVKEEYWERWNTNYPAEDILKMLEYERIYADSIEHDPNSQPYYVRAEKYRFQATYLGKTRKIGKSTWNSMTNVFTVYYGDPSVLDSLFSNEVYMQVGTEHFWMPIQNHILKAMEEEVEVGEPITLYCLFLNEHNLKNELRNIMLISEFYK